MKYSDIVISGLVIQDYEGDIKPENKESQATIPVTWLSYLLFS